MTDTAPALLVLEDGTRWPGRSFGAPVPTAGEVVFNTSLTGYQEILTDPSYHGQLVTLTMTQIGNTGINDEDMESDGIKAAALICRDLSPLASSWRSEGGLDAWLRDGGVPGIAGLDTRGLVLHIRRQGAMRGALGSGDEARFETLLQRARALPEMSGRNLAREVTCAAPYAWTEGLGWWRPEGHDRPAAPGSFRVVAMDFGVKRNILRQLAARGCELTVVPASTPAADILAREPDGVFLSNGPGDPAAVTDAIETVRALLGRVPIFGICLGHQILALALGASTYKLKFGHRGANHPVRDEETRRVEVSTHNHGFAVDPETLPEQVAVTHLSLNDGCCEGLAALDRRAFSVQYHPESSAGPHDSDHLFDRFVQLMHDTREVRHAQA